MENLAAVTESPDIGTDEIAELYSALVAASVKLSEARVRQAVVLDNSADVICSLDARLKFSSVGAASSKVWGYSPNELLGQSLMNIVAGDTAASTNAAFAAIRDSDSDGKLENIVVW